MRRSSKFSLLRALLLKISLAPRAQHEIANRQIILQNYFSSDVISHIDPKMTRGASQSKFQTLQFLRHA